MSNEEDKTATSLSHISINREDVAGHDAQESTPPRSSSGWDGKLRVEKENGKKLELANPEAISDPEYSDEENVMPGEVINADEGIHPFIRPGQKHLFSSAYILISQRSP